MGKDRLSPKKYKNVIIGAGITGLSAAYYLKRDYVLLEASDKCGGSFNSIRKKGYILDIGEKFIRIDNSKSKFFSDIFKRGFFIEQDLYSQIYMDGKRFGYPFQYNLYGMKEDKVIRCLVEVLKLYKKREKSKNFYTWILSNFGDGIAKLFMVPYNKKIWCVHPSRMSYDWFFNDKVVPRGNIFKIIEGAVVSLKDRKDPVQTRFYPRKGGASSVSEFIESRLEEPTQYNSEVVKIKVKEKKVLIGKEKKEIEYENLISTMPLDKLVDIIDKVPKHIKALTKRLEYNSLLCIIIGVERRISEKCHWIYFPENKYKFSRLYFQNNFSSNVAPKNRSIIGAVVTFKGGVPNISKLKKEIVAQLIELNILKSKSDIDFIDHSVVKYGFCIPLVETKEVSKKIRNYLASVNIFSIGRYGEWKYSGVEHALEDGNNIAMLLNGAGQKEC